MEALAPAKSRTYFNMTVKEAAHFLRNFAELTSKGTKNWDNYEGLVLDMLESMSAHYTKKS